MRVAPRAFHVSLSFLSCLPLWSVSGVLWGAAFTGRSTETRSAPRRRAVVGGASARVLRRSAQQNPYDVLGLSRSSNYDDIRAAFRKLARTDDRKGDLPVSCLQEKLSHSEFHDVAGHIIPMFQALLTLCFVHIVLEAAQSIRFLIVFSNLHCVSGKSSSCFLFFVVFSIRHR